MAKVLLIEDEKDSLEVLTWWFESKGYDVVSSGSGQQAVELGTRCLPDLVVSDYFLGDELTGVDVIAALRCHLPDLPAVLVTGMFRIATPSLDGGPRVPVLRKPFTFSDLRAAIASQFTFPPH